MAAVQSQANSNQTDHLHDGAASGRNPDDGSLGALPPCPFLSPSTALVNPEPDRQISSEPAQALLDIFCGM